MEDLNVVTLAHYVDPEILEVVEAINRLPFVEQTLFSCAGYGEQPPLKMLPYFLVEGSPFRVNKSKRHGKPYVTIQYRGPIQEQADVFHRALVKLVAYAEGHQVVPRTCSYYLLPKKVLCTKEGTSPIWERIRSLVTNWPQMPVSKKDESP